MKRFFDARALRCALVLALVVATNAGLTLAQDAPRAAIEESVEIRLIQVPLSILDPKQSTRASVRGLTLDDLDIRVDGQALSAELRRRATLDEICESLAASPGTTSPGIAATTPTTTTMARPVIAVIDFNYLDTRGRHVVADAIEELAARAQQTGETYKVYALTRQIRLLTEGFTRNPDELRRVAREVRRESFSRREIAAMGGLPDSVVDASGDPGDPFGNDDIPSDSGSVLDLVNGSLGSSFSRLDGALAGAAESLLATSQLSPGFSRIRSPYDPSASVAAIEGIIRAHTRLPGRKVLALFSTEAFRMVDESDLARAVTAIGDLARREGFTIWTVDVAGIAGVRTGASELLSALAGDSGGDTVRRTSTLARVFDGAAEQLSCYYLLSVPVSVDTDRATRRDLLVRIDTAKKPDLWNLRVMGPSTLVLPTAIDRLRDERIAALLSPEDFDDPPLEAWLDHPREVSGKNVVPGRFRLPLETLRFRPHKEGGYEARLVFDGTVERDNGGGLEILCRAGSDDTGALSLRLPRIPSKADGFGLTIEMWCALTREGLHSARGVVTDLEDERVGAARGTVVVRRTVPRFWRADDPRVLSASGNDFVWRPGWPAARRDRGREALIARDPRSLSSSSAISLEYVLCGPGTDKAAVPQHVLLHKSAAGDIRVLQSFAIGAVRFGSGSITGPGCRTANVDVPAFGLEPGDYAFAVLSGADALDAAREAAARSDVGQPLPDGLLALSPFTIAR